MLKKIISTALAVCMVFGTTAYLPAELTTQSCLTASAELCGDYDYFEVYGRDNAVEITRYFGSASNVIIPSTLNGKKVIGIEDAFYENKTVKTVTVPDGVEYVRNAFRECDNLKSVKLPDSVKDLTYAFSYCKSIEKVNLPAGVTNITGAFFACQNLDLGDLIIPDSVTEMKYAFYNCVKLKSVSIPNGVKDLSGTFSCCTGLTSVVIPESVEELDSCFSGCANLKKVKLPSKLKSIGAGAFADCVSLEKIDIPDTVTSIGNGAFSCCTGMTDFTVPENIAELGEGVFTGMAVYSGKYTDSPESVTITGTKTDISKYPFKQFLTLKVYCPKNSAAYNFAMKNEYYTYLGKAANGYELFNFADIQYDFQGNCTFTLPKTSYTYTGKKIKPTVTVKQFGNTLKAGTDYSVSYSDNVKAGTATVTLKGMGFFGGTAEVTFEITKADISNAKVTGLSDKTYTGKAIKPAPVVKVNKKTLKKGTDYTVSYKNNKSVGTATVIIKGKGNYTGTVKSTFKINPKKTALKKTTSPKTKKIKVTYNKVKGVTGYQVTYSTSKKFTKKTTKSVKTKNTFKTFSKLKKGKTYYVKVRTYKTVNGKTYYSGYSKFRRIKVK